MTTPEAVRRDPKPTMRETLLSPGYLGLLLLSALVGVPVSLVCFGFMAAQHQLQNLIWESLPQAMGSREPPWWMPLPALLLAGLTVGLVCDRMPGRGGHLPVDGFGGPPIHPREVPSVALAALACLSLGVVLGPEAPLMGLGSGLALLAVRFTRGGGDPRIGVVLSAAGSSAAISVIFGTPLPGAVLILEGAGLAAPALYLLLLPCLLASGVGALVFTGFGRWTGLDIGAMHLPKVPPGTVPDAGTFLWGIPLAALIALLITGGRGFARRIATWTAVRDTPLRIAGCGLAAGGCVSLYAVTTGRSPAEAALSGEATMAAFAADPATWPVGALVLLVLFKGLAWSICLGSMRGGPIFPALTLGSAAGIACAALPGFGAAAGLTVGIAAGGAAVMGLPVTALVLSAVLLGSGLEDQMPLLLVSAVVAYAVREVTTGTRMPQRWRRRAGGPGLSESGAGGPPAG